jgi:hypothetical protein
LHLLTRTGHQPPPFRMGDFWPTRILTHHTDFKPKDAGRMYLRNVSPHPHGAKTQEQNEHQRHLLFYVTATEDFYDGSETWIFANYCVRGINIAEMAVYMHSVPNEHRDRDIGGYVCIYCNGQLHICSSQLLRVKQLKKRLDNNDNVTLSLKVIDKIPIFVKARQQ